MNLKTLLLASACSLGLGGAAAAFDQATIDTIAGELAAQGYTKLEVKIGPNGAKIEAQGPNGALERYYDNAGNLIKEEHAGGSGSVIGDDDGDDDGVYDDKNHDDGFDDDGDDAKDEDGGDDDEEDDNQDKDDDKDDDGDDDGDNGDD